MRIAVCVKTILHLTTSMAWDAKKQALDPDGVVYQVNPSDLTAVEAAVRIKESLGAEVTLVSVGSHEAEKGLRTCLAFGADRMVLALEPHDAKPSPWRTAAILSHILGPERFDLILCGSRSQDFDQGQVGLLVAG